MCGDVASYTVGGVLQVALLSLSSEVCGVARCGGVRVRLYYHLARTFMHLRLASNNTTHMHAAVQAPVDPCSRVTCNRRN